MAGTGAFVFPAADEPEHDAELDADDVLVLGDAPGEWMVADGTMEVRA